MTEPMSGALAGLGLELRGPAFELHADGRVLRPDVMTPAADGVWRDGDVEIRLTCSEADDGSRALVLEASGVGHVEEVCLLDHDVAPVPTEIRNHRWFDSFGLQQSTVVFVRAGDGDGGVFACYANPFGRAAIDGAHVRLSYRPAMDVAGATFRSEALVVGRYELVGRQLRFDALPGRDVVDGKVPRYVSGVAPERPVAIDVGEARAVRRAVAARVPWSTPRMRLAHWDWSENLYRLDPAVPETQLIFERLIELCAELGVERLLLAPGSVHQTEPSTEGPWQHIMWLGQGTEVGHGRWQAGNEPPGMLDLLALTAKHGMGPVAYVNPQFLWCRNDGWRVQPPPDQPEAWGDYRFTCLAVAEARQWLIETLQTFVRTYGLGGISLDFVFWHPCHATDHGHAPGDDSRYAQWDGYRQVLTAIRDAAPEAWGPSGPTERGAWVEGLIGSQMLMPWGAVDMTHPHPAIGDNQPQWMPAWPDLSLDRVNANYQRRTAWWFRNLGLMPSYKVPSVVGHQSNRRHDWPVERGWDWDGAGYNLLSAIASAPSSVVVCFLPCWDEDEWSAVHQRDVPFFRRWLAFARDQAEVLARLEDLFDEAAPGAIDGTIAVGDDGRGFVFLANPNHTPETAVIPAGELPSATLLRELHPEEGRLWTSTVTVDPHEVAVLEIVPDAEVALPALVGAAGDADADGRVVAARGRPGALVEAEVRLAGGERRPVTLTFASDGVTSTLGPWQPVDGRPGVIACEWVPGASLPQLLALLAPPIPAEGDEVRQPWSDPSRLRLLIDLVDPLVAEVRAWVDGEEVPVHQAYVGTWDDVTDPGTLEHNVMGHYLDLTERLTAADHEGALDRPWSIELELAGVPIASLRGVHIAHLPPRVTSEFHT